MAVTAALGLAQILGWGTSFDFRRVLDPIVAETGWPLGAVVGGVSIGMLVAGLILPQVGRLVERHGGRPVLMTSSLSYAAGSPASASRRRLRSISPPGSCSVSAWAPGSTMRCSRRSAGLRPQGARRHHQPDAGGGFASTVCWPLSAFLIEAVGWRGACFVYAALHLGLALPAQMFAMRAAPQRLPPGPRGRRRRAGWSAARSGCCAADADPRGRQHGRLDRGDPSADPAAGAWRRRRDRDLDRRAVRPGAGGGAADRAHVRRRLSSGLDAGGKPRADCGRAGAAVECAVAPGAGDRGVRRRLRRRWWRAARCRSRCSGRSGFRG